MLRRIAKFNVQYFAMQRKGVGHNGPVAPTPINQNNKNQVKKNYNTNYNNYKNNKSSGNKAASLQLYNSNMSYHYGQYFLKFIIMGCYHKFDHEKNSMTINSSSALSIRFIEKSKMYVKGGIYGIFDLDLKRVTKFLGADISNQSQLIIEGKKQDQYIKIKLNKGQQKQNNMQTQQKAQQSQAYQTSHQNMNEKQRQQLKTIINETNKKTQNSIKQDFVAIQIKTQNLGCSFDMPFTSFQSLRQVLHQSLPTMYGIQSCYQFQMNKMIGQLLSGNVREDQYQIDPDMFAL